MQAKSYSYGIYQRDAMLKFYLLSAKVLLSSMPTMASNVTR